MYKDEEVRRLRDWQDHNAKAIFAPNGYGKTKLIEKFINKNRAFYSSPAFQGRARTNKSMGVDLNLLSKRYNDSANKFEISCDELIKNLDKRVKQNIPKNDVNNLKKYIESTAKYFSGSSQFKITDNLSSLTNYLEDRYNLVNNDNDSIDYGKEFEMLKKLFKANGLSSKSVNIKTLDKLLSGDPKIKDSMKVKIESIMRVSYIDQNRVNANSLIDEIIKQAKGLNHQMPKKDLEKIKNLKKLLLIMNQEKAVNSIGMQSAIEDVNRLPVNQRMKNEMKSIITQDGKSNDSFSTGEYNTMKCCIDLIKWKNSIKINYLILDDYFTSDDDNLWFSYMNLINSSLKNKDKRILIATHNARFLSQMVSKYKKMNTHYRIYTISKLKNSNKLVTIKPSKHDYLSTNYNTILNKLVSLVNNKSKYKKQCTARLFRMYVEMKPIMNDKLYSDITEYIKLSKPLTETMKAEFKVFKGLHRSIKSIPDKYIKVPHKGLEGIDKLLLIDMKGASKTVDFMKSFDHGLITSGFTHWLLTEV